MGEVDAVRNLQGQEGVEIRAANSTIQCKCHMQMQLMFSIAGFIVVIITTFQQGIFPQQHTWYSHPHENCQLEHTDSFSNPSQVYIFYIATH